MANFFIICGQTGVGKSTVAAHVAEGRKDTQIVNFGETIFTLARDEGLVTEREQVNHFWPDEVSRLQTMAIEQIRILSGSVILDMHLTVHTPAGYIAGMPKRMMERLKPKLIVLLEGEPYEIVRRRMVGKEMKSVEESLKDIQEHADFDRAAAMSIAVVIETPIMILKNDDLDEVVGRISAILDDDRSTR